MRRKANLTIYVEGGGDSRALLRECERAFRLLFERAGLPAGSFEVYASGPRRNAYDDFCLALANGENALLLLDSEELVATAGAAWQHLAARPDHLTQPAGATAAQAHLMVPTMEAWLLADKLALAAYYQGKFGREAFNTNALPKRDDVEQISKPELNAALENATRQNRSKGLYHKGRHSFELLSMLDPQVVAGASYHFRRLLCHLQAALQVAAMRWLDCTEFTPAI